MKVGSGRAVSFSVRGFVLTRLVSLFVMVKGMALGGRFELRLANGGAPSGSLLVVKLGFTALNPPSGGRGRVVHNFRGGCFSELSGFYNLSYIYTGLPNMGVSV